VTPDVSVGFEELLEKVRGLPPMTSLEKREQRLGWAYGQLACSTNHKPTRASFEKLALEQGWSEAEFDAWAATREWWDR